MKFNRTTKTLDKLQYKYYAEMFNEYTEWSMSCDQL